MKSFFRTMDFPFVARQARSHGAITFVYTQQTKKIGLNPDQENPQSFDIERKSSRLPQVRIEPRYAGIGHIP
jgi:hypothetical protein